MCIPEKRKMFKFPLKTSLQKSVPNFFAKIVQSVCICYRLSKELQNVKSKDWHRSKYRFSLIQVKQAVCLRTHAVGIKAQLLALSEGHGSVRKVRKFELPSSNTFKLFKKMIGGVKLPPPPQAIQGQIVSVIMLCCVPNPFFRKFILWFK